MENQTYPGHSILPNKPSFKPETITGPSVQPTTNQKASPQSANEVVDILFPKNVHFFLRKIAYSISERLQVL